MATSDGPIFPSRDPIAGDDPKNLVNPRWRKWFLNLRQDVDSTPVAVKTVTLTGQTGAQPSTPMDGGNLGAGLYAVSWYLSVVTTEAASSAQVTISWVDGGNAKSYVATLFDGSIAGNVQVDKHVLIYSDAGAPISYAVAYVGATMTYDLRIVLQSVSL